METARQYKFYHDAGHGWLEVPESEIEWLGIQDKITDFSYRHNGLAYLEEDCDAGTFVNALKEENIEYTIESIYHGNDSVIRSYRRYKD